MTGGPAPAPTPTRAWWTGKWGNVWGTGLQTRREGQVHKLGGTRPCCQVKDPGSLSRGRPPWLRRQPTLTSTLPTPSTPLTSQVLHVPGAATGPGCGRHASVRRRQRPPRHLGLLHTAVGLPRWLDTPDQPGQRHLHILRHRPHRRQLQLHPQPVRRIPHTSILKILSGRPPAGCCLHWVPQPPHSVGPVLRNLHFLGEGWEGSDGVMGRTEWGLRGWGSEESDGV